MSKKQDKDYDTSKTIIIQSDDEFTPLDLKVEPEKTGSLIIPIEVYLKTVAPEYSKLSNEHRLGGYPELFQIRGLENDQASTVPELNISKPVKMFTALYKAKIENILKEAKERQKQTN